MSNPIWEDYVSLNSGSEPKLQCLPAVSAFADQRCLTIDWKTIVSKDQLEAYIDSDPFPLPLTSDREGYYGDRHFEYWLSGLRDYLNLKNIALQRSLEVRSVLDFGCASGRVIRHFAAQDPSLETWAADINYKHIAWLLKHLPRSVKAFQNTSIPHLPLADESVDMVTAFSIFTHIETFDIAWLLEIRRILKPGGVAYLTVHSDNTLKSMDNSWPVYKEIARHPDFCPDLAGSEMDRDRIVFRFTGERSYASHVFLHSRYIKNAWGRSMVVENILYNHTGFQDAVVLRKQK